MGLATAGRFSLQRDCCSLLQKRGTFSKIDPLREAETLRTNERGARGEKESKMYPKHTRRTKILADCLASDRETDRRDVGGETDSVRGEPEKQEYRKTQRDGENPKEKVSGNLREREIGARDRFRQ